MHLQTEVSKPLQHVMIFFESFGVINGWYYTVDQYSRIKRIEHGLEDLK